MALAPSPQRAPLTMIFARRQDARRGRTAGQLLRARYRELRRGPHAAGTGKPSAAAAASLGLPSEGRERSCRSATARPRVNPSHVAGHPGRFSSPGGVRLSSKRRPGHQARRARRRAFLAAGLPLNSLSPGRQRSPWPDWRNADPGDLGERLDWPVTGALFDVQHNALWHPSGASGRPIPARPSAAAPQPGTQDDPRLRAPLPACRTGHIRAPCDVDLPDRHQPCADRASPRTSAAPPPSRSLALEERADRCPIS
jgi:hypothetical protein